MPRATVADAIAATSGIKEEAQVILPDHEIALWCVKHRLITPYEPRLVQPASYDLTLGEVVGDKRVLFPREFLLASTVETVRLPANLCAVLMGKSTLAREGLIVESAGFIDPGFVGQITLEMYNLGRDPIRLYPGMAICQVRFDELKSPAVKPYGSEGLGSHYQGQKGPTRAWK